MTGSSGYDRGAFSSEEKLFTSLSGNANGTVVTCAGSVAARQRLNWRFTKLASGETERLSLVKQVSTAVGHEIFYVCRQVADTTRYDGACDALRNWVVEQGLTDDAASVLIP